MSDKALCDEFVEFARYLRNAPANPLDEKREVSVRMILAVADAIASPTDQLAAMRGMLVVCRDTFAMYARLHSAKNPPDTAKAASNQELADLIDALFKETDQ